jgi:hypothetical protein
MVEDKSVPVPYAYMRSVILAIRAYPALKAIVADAVVPKLVEREVCISMKITHTHTYIHTHAHIHALYPQRLSSFLSLSFQSHSHTHTHTHTQQVWTTQPRVWEGLILLPKYIGTREITDKMCEALLTLPHTHMHELIKKNPDVRGALAAHVSRGRKTATLEAAKRKVLGL